MFINDLYIDWSKIDKNSYLRGIEAISDVERISFSGQVTFFVGENGSGKSTLLEAMAIAEGFNPEGGTKNYSFSTYSSHSELWDAVRISRQEKAKWGFFLSAESFYNVATMEEEYSKGPGGRPMHLHAQSHGESFISTFQNFFRKKGLYFLDEPEAALSPQKQLTLLLEIDSSRRMGSQFFIATHSPVLLGLPNSDIMTFDTGKIHSCSYEDTSSYIITSMFINDREYFLKKLFEEEK